jgi:type I restriction enzyme S subunit
MVELKSVCEKIQIGPFGTQLHQEDYQDSGIPIINPKHIKGSMIFPEERISIEKANSLSQYYLRKGDVIMARRGEMGRVAYIDEEQNGWFCGTGSLFIRLKENYEGKLYQVFFRNQETVNYLEKASRGVTMANLNLDIIQNLPIPNIPNDVQQEILNNIKQEQQLVNANKELIKIYEQKIKDEINKLWQPGKKEKVYEVVEDEVSIVAEG